MSLELMSFLSPHLREELQTGPPDADRRFPAALLFADVSGFTALTERLQGRGREGAEEVVALVDRALTAAIAAMGLPPSSPAAVELDDLAAAP